MGPHPQQARNEAPDERVVLDMKHKPPIVVILVKPNTPARQPAMLLRWLRWLLPAALLVVSQAPIATADADDVITLNADAVDSSPLAVADAIVKARDGQ